MQCSLSPLNPASTTTFFFFFFFVAATTSSFSLPSLGSARPKPRPELLPKPFPPHHPNSSPHRNRRRVIPISSQLRHPIISPDHWGLWTALFAADAFGIWSEKTEIGGMVSAALLSTLIGLAASNISIIPHEACVYNVVLEFLLPLVIPLLLFRADLKNVARNTGTLLLAFKIRCVYGWICAGVSGGADAVAWSG